MESSLITYWDRIIIPMEMRTEMLQYIHEGHQGRNVACLGQEQQCFGIRLQMIEKCAICQEFGKSQLLIGATQETPPFPWHTIATDLFYWKRMDFLIIADVFSKFILVRKLPNSTSQAVCIELSMIVTEPGLPHIVKSDNGLCYSSKEFQGFLQLYSIMYQTSSPNHLQSNGFVERIVGVAKKLMDKAGTEQKPWISGLLDYRITPQPGSLESPLQMMTQPRPRKRCVPQLPSALGAKQMHQTCQELVRRQGNKPEREYQDLLPGTPVYVQHKPNARWEAATVVCKADAPNSYWDCM